MQYYSLKGAIVRIIGSVFAVFGALFLMWFLIDQVEEARINDSAYTVQVIATKSHSADEVSSQVFAELFQLSTDVPTNLYQFDLQRALTALKEVGCFKRASIMPLPPGVLLIDYELRTPIASICDWENMAIDDAGHFFFLYPFYSAKQLPAVYLGGTEDARIALALRILSSQPAFEALHLRIKEMDLRSSYYLKASAEIVLVFEKLDEIKTLYYVRLRKEVLDEALGRFTQILPILEAEAKKNNLFFTQYIIDLRTPSFALYRCAV